MGHQHNKSIIPPSERIKSLPNLLFVTCLARFYWGRQSSKYIEYNVGTGVTNHISMVSCQKGPTRHAHAWQIRPFWQDTLDYVLTRGLFWCSYPEFWSNKGNEMHELAFMPLVVHHSTVWLQSIGKWYLILLISVLFTVKFTASHVTKYVQ